MDARERQTGPVNRRMNHQMNPQSRRRFLQQAVAAVAATAGGAVLAACGEATAPTATVAPATRAATVAAATPAVSPAVSPAAPTSAPAPTTAPAMAQATAAPAAAAMPTTAAVPVTAAPVAASPSGAPAASAMPAAAGDGRIPSPLAGVPDAYTKLPPPFKSVNGVPGRGGKVTTFHIQYNNPIAPRDQNRFWQELEKRLGVQIEPTFASGNGGYQEKLPALTASGDMPDLTFVWLDGAPSVNRTVQQGAFTDLTPYLTGDGLKEFPNLALFPSDIWKRAAFNGKVYGVPRPRIRAVDTLTYRQDWGEKLGFGTVKNADDVYNVFTGFSKGDPDGNGKVDSFGLGNQNTNLFGKEFFYYMFRVPNMWRKNADGTLTSHIESEEYRAAIAFMRRLWEGGAYHPDSLTMTVTQVNELFSGSRLGGYKQGVEGIPGPSGRRAQTRALNPNANVIGLVPPGHDGGKAATWVAVGYYGYTTIPAKLSKDTGRVKELLRILDYYAAPFGSEEWLFLNYGIEGVHHDIRPNGQRVRNDTGLKEIGELTNLTYCLPPFYFDTPGDAETMQTLQRDLLSLGVDNPVLGLYSPTNTLKAGELSQLQNDRHVAIITGREPLSALDQFVKDWRSRGGDMIRKEYEDLLKMQ